MTSPHPIAILSSKTTDAEALITSAGIAVVRFPTLASFFESGATPSALIIAADDYPHTPPEITTQEWERLFALPLRIYVEFAGTLPDHPAGELKQATRLERAYVTDASFGFKDAILTLSSPTYYCYDATEIVIAIRKVAGYDRLAFPLGEDQGDPILFHGKRPGLMIAATRLTQFREARFAPRDAVAALWRHLIGWLIGNGEALDPALSYPLICEASYPEETTLPDEAQAEAVQRSLWWFHRAGMLLSAGDEEEYRAVTTDEHFLTPRDGDGSGGVLEGYVSEIDYRGLQPHRWWRRADCTGEVAAAFALSPATEESTPATKVAENLLDWMGEHSELTGGVRSDPEAPDYGLIGWHDRPRYGRFHHANGWDIYYGDDNARAILGAIAAGGYLQIPRWNDLIIRGILGNFRTSGPHGFRRNAIWNSFLSKEGWEHYFTSEELPDDQISPHYQCYLWACYLWLHAHTGDEALLIKAKRGISKMVESYPERWRWTNGLQQERARMLLPLAWLIRVEDTPEHRSWLHTIANDLLEHQQPNGAIREVLASSDGKYGPPRKHDDYGLQEASLLQNDGDPVVDLLYTCNFAFLGLHEAAAATGEQLYHEAEEKLAEFLIRIQCRSENPAFDGVWYRTFDYRRWELWGSDADGAWGAWCTETGWTQAWITTVLALRLKGQSLWGLPLPPDFQSCFEAHHSMITPDPQPTPSPVLI